MKSALLGILLFLRVSSSLTSSDEDEGMDDKLTKDDKVKIGPTVRAPSHSPWQDCFWLRVQCAARSVPTLDARIDYGRGAIKKFGTTCCYSFAPITPGAMHIYYDPLPQLSSVLSLGEITINLVLIWRHEENQTVRLLDTPPKKISHQKSSYWLKIIKMPWEVLVPISMISSPFPIYLGIICRPFRGSFAARDHLRTCTAPKKLSSNTVGGKSHASHLSVVTSRVCKVSIWICIVSEERLAAARMPTSGSLKELQLNLTGVNEKLVSASCPLQLIASTIAAITIYTSSSVITALDSCYFSCSPLSWCFHRVRSLLVI